MSLENKRVLAEIKERLHARKRELEDTLTRMSAERFSDGTVGDIGDQASSSTMEALKMSLQEAEQEEYNRITKALAMIEEGTYGICVDCDQPISEKRLKFYPNATRCLVCQERYEAQI